MDKTRWTLGTWRAAALALLLASVPALGAAREVAIVTPQPEQTIHDNTGHVTVAVRVDGGGRLARGERLRLLLDGKPAGKDRRSLAAALEGVARGTHSVQALVVDRDGTVAAYSDPVTFHLWQASRLFPNRRR